MTRLFGKNGTLSPTKLFGEGGEISHPPRLLDHNGDPIRRDAPEAYFRIGHPISFSSILSSGYRTYIHGQYDQAMKHSREDALSMRNDPFLQSLMQERKLATASLRWSIEIDDERDPLEVAVRETLTKIIRNIPRFRMLCMYLLEAIWYGRYGSEIVWKWEHGKMPSVKDPKKSEVTRYLGIKAHKPINGDKIGHHFDGTPYVLVNPAFDTHIQDAEMVRTTVGADGLLLRGHWRNHFIIHKHEAVDADYFDPMGADAVHGLGIRSVLFWYDWLRKEWLGNVADWCERTGLGIRLWYFQGGSAASEAAVKKAAKESTDRTNIFIPRFGGTSASAEGVEYVDTSGTGASLLLDLQKHLEEHEERYVVGQTMSSGRDNQDGLGGTGRADFARHTKGQLVAYDAANLGETLTIDVVKPAQYWTFRNNRDAQRVNARLVFSTDADDPDKLMTSIKTFVVDLGGSVREDGVRQALGKGFEKPQQGEAVISMETINEQKQAGMPQMPGMPGMPGMPPGAGDVGGPPGAPPGGGDLPGGQPPQPGAEGQQQPTPPPPPGGGDVQEKVNKQLDQMLQRMERMEEVLRYGADSRSASRGIKEEIAHAEAQTEREPTEAQKESGDYRKGKLRLHGMLVEIETPKGAVRSGVGEDGKPWKIKMKNSYGYIATTESKADGDHVDVFLGPTPESEIVFVVDQLRKDGTFDEHKCIIGAVSEAQARELYLANYEDGWDRIGGIKAMPIQSFREWVHGSRTDSKASDHSITY